jgi:hypothetical protein
MGIHSFSHICENTNDDRGAQSKRLGWGSGVLADLALPRTPSHHWRPCLWIKPAPLLLPLDRLYGANHVCTSGPDVLSGAMVPYRSHPLHAWYAPPSKNSNTDMNCGTYISRWPQRSDPSGSLGELKPQL